MNQNNLYIIAAAAVGFYFVHRHFANRTAYNGATYANKDTAQTFKAQDDIFTYSEPRQNSFDAAPVQSEILKMPGFSNVIGGSSSYVIERPFIQTDGTPGMAY